MNAIDNRHDLRRLFGPARDQGTRETCVAFAMSDAHAAARGRPWEPLSCEFLFYHAKQRDKGRADQGTTIPAIRAAMEFDGQPHEAIWPYLQDLPKDLNQWKPPGSAQRLFHRASNETGSPFSEVWTAIETGTLTIIAITLSNAFFLPDADCIVDANEAAEPSLRHAVVGVATGTRGGQKYVLVRNSWGNGWGCSGYAWLSERYVARRILCAITLN